MADFFYDALIGPTGSPPTTTATRLIDDPAYEGVVKRLRRVGVDDNTIEQTLQEQQQRTAQAFQSNTQPGPDLLSGGFENILEGMQPQGGVSPLTRGRTAPPVRSGGFDLNSFLSQGLEKIFGEPGASTGDIPHVNPHIGRGELPAPPGGPPDFLSAMFGGAARGGPVPYAGSPSPHVGMAIPAASAPPKIGGAPPISGPFGPPGPRTAPPLPPGMPGPSIPGAGPPAPGPLTPPTTGSATGQVIDQDDPLQQLLEYPGLMELGLRLMAAAEGRPGDVRGPSFFGAVGQAGLSQLQADEARAVRKASADFAREQFDEEKRAARAEEAIDREEIAADIELRRATLELKQETENRVAEIQRLRASTDARTFELRKQQLSVDIADWERKEKEDRLEADPMSQLDKEKRAEIEKEVRKAGNEMREAAGLQKQH